MSHRSIGQKVLILDVIERYLVNPSAFDSEYDF